MGRRHLLRAIVAAVLALGAPVDAVAAPHHTLLAQGAGSSDLFGVQYELGFGEAFHGRVGLGVPAVSIGGGPGYSLSGGVALATGPRQRSHFEASLSATYLKLLDEDWEGFTVFPALGYRYERPGAPGLVFRVEAGLRLSAFPLPWGGVAVGYRLPTRSDAE